MDRLFSEKDGASEPLDGSGAAIDPKGKTMTRNLKALGLALVALFAFAAVAASGASAQRLTTEGSKAVTLTGTETGATYDNSLTVFGNRLHCPGSTITGHKKMTEAETATRRHDLIQPNATEITLTPHLRNCTTEEGANRFSTTVDMNGCDYLLTIGALVSLETYKTDVHVVCPSGRFIEVTQFSSASHALRVCTEKITTTTPTSHAHIRNTPAAFGTRNDLDIVGTFTDIEAHKSGLCGSATSKVAELHIDVTVKAIDSLGAQTGITIS
jgi:hypothetical protein